MTVNRNSFNQEYFSNLALKLSQEMINLGPTFNI